MTSTTTAPTPEGRKSDLRHMGTDILPGVLDGLKPYEKPQVRPRSADDIRKYGEKIANLAAEATITGNTGPYHAAPGIDLSHMNQNTPPQGDPNQN